MDLTPFAHSVGRTTPLDPRAMSLATVLASVRDGSATTRPEVERVTDLGRKVVSQRVAELVAAGLLDEATRGPSSGGRAPRRLRFVAEAGAVLVAHFGATGMAAAVADLRGTILARSRQAHPIDAGPDAAVDLMVREWDALLAQLAVGGDDAGSRIWGVGIGVPGPVEFASAHPVSPPIMPGWDEFPIRERVQERWAVPVWVDNEVNAMALGEMRAGVARDSRDLLYVKIGTGIGAGIVADGHLLRGSRGAAGDIGHIAVRDRLGIACRCGRQDCLEAVAGGAALVEAATRAARSGESPVLTELFERDGHLDIAHLREAAGRGDHVTLALLDRSGRLIGDVIAALVNTLNPDRVILGGPIADTSDVLLATVRQAVYDRSLPLATRDLVLTRSSDSIAAGIIGAAFTALDEMFSAHALTGWIEAGSPASTL